MTLLWQSWSIIMSYFKKFHLCAIIHLIYILPSIHQGGGHEVIEQSPPNPDLFSFSMSIISYAFQPYSGPHIGLQRNPYVCAMVLVLSAYPKLLCATPLWLHILFAYLKDLSSPHFHYTHLPNTKPHVAASTWRFSTAQTATCPFFWEELPHNAVLIPKLPCSNRIKGKAPLIRFKQGSAGHYRHVWAKLHLQIPWVPTIQPFNGVHFLYTLWLRHEEGKRACQPARGWQKTIITLTLLCWCNEGELRMEMRNNNPRIIALDHLWGHIAEYAFYYESEIQTQSMDFMQRQPMTLGLTLRQ